MLDNKTTVDALKDEVRSFIERREWDKYHNPRDLAMSLSIEAAELLEVFQWRDSMEIEEKMPELRGRIEEELADIAIYALSLCIALKTDLSRIIIEKMKKNEDKYPVDRYKGKAHL